MSNAPGSARSEPAQGLAGRGSGRADDGRSRLIVALDIPDPSEIERLSRELAGLVGYFKIGLEPFCALGPRAVELVRPFGDVFLDLKLHDIPRTVEAAAREATRHGAGMLNVHALGGREMMRAALEGARSALGGDRPLVIAVTVLTSLSTEDIRAMGFSGSAGELALHLAREAKATGLDGVVAAAEDAPSIKDICGQGFLVVSPGIRPAGSEAGDQKRVTAPKMAVELGADYIVVGRPITQASNPREAAENIVGEIEQGVALR